MEAPPQMYSREDLARESRIPEEEIVRLEALKIFEPSGRTAGNTPYYEAGKLEDLRHVTGLLQLGYEPTEVRRILHKVGTPRKSESRDRRPTRYLTVGELAEKTGVGARTLKHWEEKGILSPDTRSGGGFRLYSQRFVSQVELIRDLQLFGFKLEEIKEFADHLAALDDLQSAPSSQASQSAAAERCCVIAESLEKLMSHTGQLKAAIGRWEKWLAVRRKESLRIAEKLASQAKEQRSDPDDTKGGHINKLIGRTIKKGAGHARIQKPDAV